MLLILIALFIPFSVYNDDLFLLSLVPAAPIAMAYGATVYELKKILMYLSLGVFAVAFLATALSYALPGRLSMDASLIVVIPCLYALISILLGFLGFAFSWGIEKTLRM